MNKMKADPRIAAEQILVTQEEHGLAVQVTLKYIPLDITEKLRFAFDENSLLRLS